MLEKVHALMFVCKMALFSWMPTFLVSYCSEIYVIVPELNFFMRFKTKLSASEYVQVSVMFVLLI